MNYNDKLKGLIPDDVLKQLPEAIARGASNPLRLAHFLAQCAHESGSFKSTSENLNYSAERLKEVFGKHFFGTSSIDFAHKPEKIANRVYANRLGNGNEQTGDGFRFRGRGFLQLSFKFNYEQFSLFVGEDVVKNPDLVATKYALTSAVFFFEKNGLWAICDKGSSVAIVTQLTKRINGGTNGLDDRINRFNEFYKALTSVHHD